jgi:hypothetical protein
MTEEKKVALASSNALASIPMSVEEMAADANLGGKMGMADISIPYVYLLQSNSPQCNADHEKYIKGAAASMVLLTVSDKIFEGRTTGVTIVPCYYERKIMEWIDRDAGGGLIGSYPADDPIMKKATPNAKGQMVLPNGHMLMDTAYHYILIKDGNSWVQAIMPLKSTALKASRKWNSALQTTTIPGSAGVRAPRFLYQYQLTTMKEQKDQNIWNSPVFTQGEMVTKEVYDAAKTYAKIASQNLLQRAPDTSGKGLDDELPF